ncbi:MAG: FkbM family methyltransferase [Anaerolineae bacterium]|nr:FkbM family methyltransferase [Anaerolineae bacterium]
MYRIKRFLRQFQAPTQIARPITGVMALRDRYSDLHDLLKNDNLVIVDGGANIGTVTDLFLQQYDNPTIHAIEPRPDAALVMQSKYKNQANVHVHMCALGAEDATLSFNVVGHETSSSLLKPSSTNHHYHPDIMAVTQSINVPVKRLDTLVDIDIDLLKLDLQGYELEALKGCGALLQRIKTITTEVEFIPLYDKQPLFADIDIFLRGHGFKLFNLYELWTQDDGQLTAGDAVYLNTRYF